MILVPVKNLSTAKQRLSTVLNRAARSALAEAMLEDVLHTLARWTHRPPVAVVTSDPRARRLAEQFSFEIIEDRVNQGESEAIAMATRICEARGASDTVVLPGDIPFLQVSELESIFAAAPAQGTLLVPSADGRGTNAALRRPPALFPLRFGDASFERHLRAARATGKPCATLRLPGIALDIDTPADVALLLAAESRTRTQRLLRAWNVRDPLLAASSR